MRNILNYRDDPIRTVTMRNILNNRNDPKNRDNADNRENTAILDNSNPLAPVTLTT